jgi:penicillin amidase
VYPKKGWLKENQWLGAIPNEELPKLLNPKKGYIVSANNLITTKNVLHGISHAFSFPHRFVRINEMIEEKIIAKGKLNELDMMEMQ